MQSTAKTRPPETQSALRPLAALATAGAPSRALGGGGSLREGEAVSRGRGRGAKAMADAPNSASNRAISVAASVARAEVSAPTGTAAIPAMLAGIAAR